MALMYEAYTFQETDPSARSSFSTRRPLFESAGGKRKKNQNPGVKNNIEIAFPYTPVFAGDTV